jgi:hypothetical protein
MGFTAEHGFVSGPFLLHRLILLFPKGQPEKLAGRPFVFMQMEKQRL